MAATLTATPNPVGLWDPAATGTTTIAWNTGNPSLGQVYLSVNGATPVLFDGGTAGTRTGSKAQTVKLGETYVFTLRRVTDKALLATLTVTVEDLQQRMVDQVIASMALLDRFDPPQSILNLIVEPTVDMVQVRFHTGRPAIPLVVVETLDGTQLVSWFPLLGGLQTRHVAWLGGSDPLPQGTSLRLRITVPGRKPIIGATKDVVRSVVFKTGTRSVDVLFDTIEVRTDGDPGIKGAGEFKFRFVAGDASDNFDFGAPTFERDISAGDPPVIVDSNIALPVGPRNVYVRVVGTEWDFAIPLGVQGLNMVGTGGERDTGSGWRTSDFVDEAWVADVFDVSDLGFGVTTIPMVLRTGDFGVAFTVNGRIMTFVHPGEGVFSLPFDLFPSQIGVVLSALSAKGFIAGGVPGSGMLVASGEDGGLWTKTVDPQHPIPRHDGWMQAAPSPRGSITAARSQDGKVELVAVGANGEALHWTPGDGRRKGAWQTLGGAFVGALTMVAGRRNQMELIGVDREGRVVHRALGGRAIERGNWQVIGEGIAGGLIALAVPDVGLALFAIDRAGKVVHALRRAGERFGAEGVAWHSLGGPKAGWLGAGLIERGGVVVSVLTEDRVLFVLPWRKYPADRGAHAWKDKGAFDELQGTAPFPRPSTEGRASKSRIADSSTQQSSSSPRRPAASTRAGMSFLSTSS